MTKITLPAQRRVGHLTLLRHERDISLAEFNALSAAEQLDIIHQFQGKKKTDLIFNSQHAETLVPLLHPQELYLTINDLGSDDAPELLALASPEQISLFLDMDCWDGDRLSPVLSLHWLNHLLLTGEAKLRQLARELEPEVLALFLKKHLTIIRGIEVFDDDDCENAKRLESLYDIEYHSEDAAKVIGALLKIWMEQEQETYLLIMEMIRSEQLSILEEEVFQARNNRLLDLGILSAAEAKTIYAHLDPESFTSGEKSDFKLESASLQAPNAVLAYAEPCNLLAGILGGGISHELACELLFLVNRKMSADQIDYSDSQVVGNTVQAVYDTLNLALEYLAGRNEARAAEIFTNTYLARLFQLGHNLLEQRLKKAKALSKNPLYAFMDYPELLFIDSLLDSPAFIYQAAIGETPSSLQPIRTIRDLEQIDLRLEQIAALGRLFDTRLPFNLEHYQGDQDELPTLAQTFNTAVANQLLGRSFNPDPLACSDLGELRSRTFANSQLTDDFKQQVSQFIYELDDRCAFFSRFCLELWEEALGEFNRQDDGFYPTAAFIVE